MKLMLRLQIGDGIVQSLSLNSVNTVMNNRKKRKLNMRMKCLKKEEMKNREVGTLPRRLTKVTLPESSSKRKRQETSSEYVPDSASDAAIQRRRQESINKRWGDRQYQPILRDVEVSAQRQVTVVAVSTKSTSTSSSQQLYRRKRKKPLVAVTTPILTKSVTITPTTIQTTTIPTSIPTTTLQHISEPFPELDFIHGFEFDEIFNFPTHQAKASSSRGPDPGDARITTLETQVAGLLEMKQQMVDEKQRKEHDAMVKLVCDMAKTLAAQGERLKELLEKQPPKPSSGGDALGRDKGKSVADVLKDLSDDMSDDVILLLEPDYSKEAQIDALCNLDEGEIESGDDWDEEDEDVVIEVPKGDGEREYKFEDGEIFEAPFFETNLDTGSVEPVSTVEASTEASPNDPTPVDPEAQKIKHTPASSSKDLTPVWQKTSIINKHGPTGMILAVRFEDDKKLFAIKRAGGVQYLKPTSEAFSSLPKYDLVNLANRKLLGHSNHAVAMGL
ncbi:hypothetical protein L1987_37806 [Smallanthus sonchifolius]|uniref:Uncharacterized protein n=1 Tax=Smallanthus sonchifolius TaxID=185202 RepID=A0ACB9HHC2_9ASTR|nr:hypothetical protein L1987_37806 [Smallanthus sonchifolius]